jgi:hypothetical protein
VVQAANDKQPGISSAGPGCSNKTRASTVPNLADLALCGADDPKASERRERSCRKSVDRPG